MSPEILKEEPYNQKTDVWALGCILFEMLTRDKAYSGGNEEALKRNIINNKVPRIMNMNNKIPPDFIKIYDYMMIKD